MHSTPVTSYIINHINKLDYEIKEIKDKSKEQEIGVIERKTNSLCSNITMRSIRRQKFTKG